MKIKSTFTCLALVFFAGANWAAAQGTAFTYQGRLNSGGSPANGSYDFQFILFNAAQSGLQVGSILTKSAVPVNNGLFSATLDFGPGVFTGTNLWLDLSVRTNGNGAFAELLPRQALLPVPYAIMANSASNLLGRLPAAQLSGTIANGALPGSPNLSGTVTASAFAGNGAGLTTLNASQLASGAVPMAALTNAWRIAGNTGTSPTNGNFLGTADNNPLEIHVYGFRALRLEPAGGVPNVIGGAPQNAVATGVAGSVIGGGQLNQIYSGASFSSIVGGYENVIQTNADFSAIGGGWVNGINNNSMYAVIAGGAQNSILDYSGYSVIGGGQQNQIASNADFSAIVGGALNVINPGAHNSFLGGGENNTIQQNSHDSTIAGGQYNQVSSNATYSTVAGGNYNEIQAGSAWSAIGGGYDNWISNSTYAVIAGGQINLSDGPYSFIGGGSLNKIQSGASYAAIGGGNYNTIQTGGSYGTIPGGLQNMAAASAFAAGSWALATNQGSFVWADASRPGYAFNSTANNQFIIRAANGVGINTNNTSGATLTVNGTIFATGFSGNLSGMSLASGPVSAALNFTNLYNSFTGNGGGLTNVTASALTLPSTAVSPDIIYSGSASLLYGDNNGNFFSGQGAGNPRLNGSDNTAIGVQALASITNGSDNTALGFQALKALGFGTRAGGTNNIALGYLAGILYNGNESGNIDIGNFGQQGENNTIHIGTPGVQTQTFIAGVINGDGGGLTDLNGANLLAGSVGTAQLAGGALAAPVTVAGPSSTLSVGDLVALPSLANQLTTPTRNVDVLHSGQTVPGNDSGAGRLPKRTLAKAAAIGLGADNKPFERFQYNYSRCQHLRSGAFCWRLFEHGNEATPRAAQPARRRAPTP